MTFWALGGLDQLGANIHSYGDMDGYLANARADNSIAYMGVFGKTTIGATYSFGRDTAALPAGANCNESTESKACRNVSVMARYDSEQWGVAASHEISYGGAGAGAGLVSSNLSDSRSVIGGYGNIGSSLLVGGGVIVRKNEGDAKQPRSNLWFVGATYTLTPQWIVDAQVARLDFIDSPNDSNYFDARLNYKLSKRTSVYLSVGHIVNHGTAAISVSGGTAAGAAPRPGTAQSGAMVGVRHSF
jgi:predicted porin